MRLDRPTSEPREPTSGASPDALLLWPFAAAKFATDSLRWWLETYAGQPPAPNATAAPDWTTPNDVVLQLTSMRLRDFSPGGDGRAVLICAPFALHRALIADFAPGHSIVETLRAGGVERVFVTDWRSATPDMRYLSIDSYLSDLNIAIDEIGPPVDLVGLCQGGWLSLVYAARFPHKVRRLVLVGAPIDMRAASELSRLVAELPVAGFEELVRRGEGIVSGRNVIQLWSNALVGHDLDELLQRALTCEPTEREKYRERFRAWDAAPLDLPGAYYLQVVSWIFKENRIAEDRFVALGRTLRLAEVTAPLFLLTADDDEIVPAAQTLAAARLVGTPPALVEKTSEPCTHLGLFMGREALGHSWQRVARWLTADAMPALERKTATG
jgi:poly(3-hydroxyalkanoate) synthetase